MPIMQKTLVISFHISIEHQWFIITTPLPSINCYLYFKKVYIFSIKWPNEQVLGNDVDSQDDDAIELQGVRTKAIYSSMISAEPK